MSDKPSIYPSFLVFYIKYRDVTKENIRNNTTLQFKIHSNCKLTICNVCLIGTHRSLIGLKIHNNDLTKGCNVSTLIFSTAEPPIVWQGCFAPNRM